MVSSSSKMWNQSQSVSKESTVLWWEAFEFFKLNFSRYDMNYIAAATMAFRRYCFIPVTQTIFTKTSIFLIRSKKFTNVYKVLPLRFPDVSVFFQKLFATKGALFEYFFDSVRFLKIFKLRFWLIWSILSSRLGGNKKTIDITFEMTFISNLYENTIAFFSNN